MLRRVFSPPPPTEVAPPHGEKRFASQAGERPDAGGGRGAQRGVGASPAPPARTCLTFLRSAAVLATIMRKV